MSNHTTPSSHPKPKRPNPSRRSLPRGRAKLVALRVARIVAFEVSKIRVPRGFGHLRNHLVRAADNTKLRLSEASGHTGGLRYIHLEHAYAENQEVQGDLDMLCDRGIEISSSLIRQADRLGGLIYGLLRSELRSDE